MAGTPIYHAGWWDQAFPPLHFVLPSASDTVPSMPKDAQTIIEKDVETFPSARSVNQEDLGDILDKAATAVLKVIGSGDGLEQRTVDSYFAWLLVRFHSKIQ
jgi:23S rRNA G2069 N7-methylase RlmK/C1962 C5-methylase RlmI